MKFAKILMPLVAVSAFAFAGQAEATLYNFNVDYSGGGVASLASGSDDPTATNLAAGDSFNYSLSATGSGYWDVFSGGTIFPFFAFETLDSGTRTADFTLALYLNGVLQVSLAHSNITNSFAHIGTNDVTLSTGLQFDKILLNYDLLASDNVNNRPYAILPFPNKAPEQYSSDKISYVASSETVPEPTSLALLGLGLAGLGFAKRRR